MLFEFKFIHALSFGNQSRASINICSMNNLQTMTNTGVRKRLYWGFQIEHRNKIENLNLTPWFKVRHCCSKKHSNCLYIDIPLVLWSYFINLPPPHPPPSERNDQPVIDLCAIDIRLIAFCFWKLKSSRQLFIETLF